MMATETEMRRRALFLMHNFNDIDHQTPVVDALMQTGRWDCSIVFYPAATHGSVDFESDWRLRYLREEHGVESARIEDVAPSSQKALRLFRRRESLIGLCKKTPFMGRLFGRDPRGVLPWFLAARSFDRHLSHWLTDISAIGHELVDRYRPDVVVIDWGKTHNVLTPLLSMAKRSGIPVVQLPHGAWTYEGIYSHASQFDDAKLAKKVSLPETTADIVVIDNLYKGYRSEVQGVARERMRFLGLPRFTPQWISKLSSLPRGTSGLASSGKPKLVWFPTWLMACDLDGVDRTLAVLEEYADRLDIVLKVHTRNPSSTKSDYIRRLSPNSRIRVVANEEESFAVTRWADYVLITQSSIVYDAFLLDKPVLYLKYTHDFDCMWEVDEVGVTLQSADELRRVLDTIVSGEFRAPYSKQAVDRYLKLGVSGGLSPESVLESYIELFDQIVSGQNVTAGLDFAQTVELWDRQGRTVTNTERTGRAA